MQKQPEGSAPHYYVTLIVAALVGCASAQPIAPDEASFEITVDAAGVPRDKIHDGAKIWIAANFKSSRAVIDLDDKPAGILIGNGRIAYPCSGIECLAKGAWKIGFKMRLDARDGRFRLQFSNLTLIVPPPNGFERAISMRGEFDNAKQAFLAFGPQIRAAILRERADSF